MTTFRVNAEGRRQATERLKTTGGEHLLPLLKAADVGVTTVFVVGKERFPARRVHKGQGLIAVIGDDLGIAQGPTGFHLGSLRKLASKADAWTVMSGAAVAAVYATAADKAMTGAIVLLIETQVQEERSWTDYLTRHGRRTATKLLVSPTAKRAA
jgi:hypothetical protein